MLKYEKIGIKLFQLYHLTYPKASWNSAAAAIFHVTSGYIHTSWFDLPPLHIHKFVTPLWHPPQAPSTFWPPCVRNLWPHTASRDSFMGPSKMTRNLGRDHVSREWLIEFTKGFATGFALFKTKGWQCTAQLNSIIPCLLETDLMTFLHFSGLTLSIQNHCVCIEIYMLSSSFETSRTHGFWKIQR